MSALSRSSEYAIRALTHLAQHQAEGRYHLAREMAETLGIPAPFLGKILQPLVGAGVLESQRGRHGGFRLVRPASELTLQEVVDSQEQPTRKRACVLGQADCSDERPCPLHEEWTAADGRFRASLARTTLEELARRSFEHPASGYPLPSPPGGRDDGLSRSGR